MIVPFDSLILDCKIVLVDSYRHFDPWTSGVLWAAIEDSRGHRSHVCIDDRADSPTRGRIYVDARHPSKQRAKLVLLGDETEGALVSLFSRWCDDPANWGTRAGGYREEFRARFISYVLSIGSYSP